MTVLRTPAGPGKRTDVTVPPDVLVLIDAGARALRVSKNEFERRAIRVLIDVLRDEPAEDAPSPASSAATCPTCGQALRKHPAHRGAEGTVRLTLYADETLLDDLRDVSARHFRGVMSHAVEAGVRLLAQETGVSS